MSYYSVWPMVAILAVVFALVATPLFSAADSPPIPTRARVDSLDGLRGFLALAVFFHHGELFHGYLRTGRWGLPTDRLYGLLGSFGVSMFFMITGFLFWSQILAKRGRPDWVRLYIGRIFRIGPIYLATLTIMVACVFAVTGLRLNVPAPTLALELGQWSALGFWSGMPINGLAHPDVFLAFGAWSLRWEWFFYASLIVTALCARRRAMAWALPSLGLLGALTLLCQALAISDGPSPFAFLALFCVGMLTATARASVAKVNFDTPIFSAIAACALLAVLTLFSTAYQALPIVIIGIAFFFIANGTTIFRLLATRAARRLGDISFGIYLLQGLALAGVFALPAARTFALTSPMGHWTLVALAAVSLVSVSAIAHVFIERPGVTLGRKVSAAIIPFVAAKTR